jgi:DNA replication protein DnaC
MNPTVLVKEIKPKPYLRYQEGYDFEKRLESFMRIAEIICPEFAITDENRAIYENTIRYFAADESCEYNLNKGLYVYGQYGVGKTLYFKIFKALNRAIDSPNNFKILTVTDLIDGVSHKGYQYFLDSGVVPAGGSGSSCNSLWSNQADHYLLDDMGQSERFANNYGNKIDVVIAFLQRRYYAFTDSFSLTHCSTNLIPSEIESEYGEAINSRLRQMCNVILFPGEDKRK